MKNMMMGWVGEVLVVLHGRSTPTDAEWTAYLDQCVEQRRALARGERPRQLVVTDGGAPNLAQRRLAHARAGDANIPVAVVTASRLARFVANALVASRTNSFIRVFAAEEMDAAFRFLGLDRGAAEARIAALREALERSDRPRRRLGSGAPPARPKSRRRA